MTNRESVAKKLRGSEDRPYGSSFYGGALKAVDVIREYIEATYDYEDFFNRLSSLIDPTCKPVITVENLTESLTVPVELYTKLKQIVDCWGSSVNGYLV